MVQLASSNNDDLNRNQCTTIIDCIGSSIIPTLILLIDISDPFLAPIIQGCASGLASSIVDDLANLLCASSCKSKAPPWKCLIISTVISTLEGCTSGGIFGEAGKVIIPQVVFDTVLGGLNDLLGSTCESNI